MRGIFDGLPNRLVVPSPGCWLNLTACQANIPRARTPEAGIIPLATIETPPPQAPTPAQPQVQYIPIMQPPPAVPLGTLPSTAAFQEMLELLRVSEVFPNSIKQPHSRNRKTKLDRGRRLISSKSWSAI